MRLNRLNQLVGPDGASVDGTWRLARGNELQYRRLGDREEVVVSGPLVGAGPNGLSFRVEADSLEGDRVGETLELRGRWQADPENRLTFLAERRAGKTDVLKLEGGWEIGPSQQILYRFEREELGRKSRTARLLRFSGYWDLDEEKRLTYVLDKGSGSEFRFRGAFQTHSVLAKTGAIRWQLGAELDGRRPARTVTLFGKWKLSRRLDLSFEVPYSGGRVRGIDFGAELGLDSRGNLACRLLTRRGEPLGLEVLLTRSFFRGDGELFARLRRSAEETAVEAGVRVRW